MSRISRRELLVVGTGAAAAVIAFPHVSGALGRSRSGLGPVVVGEGAHQYEVIHDWGTLPQEISWGNTHGVCEDSFGNIYIKHTVHANSVKSDAIVVFDADGKFVRSWGAQYKGGAHGLHLSRESDGEFLYICDQARGVVDKSTLAGEIVWSRACPIECGLYNAPNEYHATNVAVIPSGPRAGEVFVADGYGKSWIHRYSAKGDYLGYFGGPGKERGQMLCPHGLMVDTRGESPQLVVADRSNNRLQIFDLDGRHQGFVTDNLKMPCHFDQREGVLLVPDLMARVTLLDKDNKLICHLGDGENFQIREQARDTFVPGKFIAPHSAIFDHSGNIYVVEWVEVGRVTKLRKV